MEFKDKVGIVSSIHLINLFNVLSGRDEMFIFYKCKLMMNRNLSKKSDVYG